jgi:UDP-N-acetylmuramyl tripeptide synthase
MPFPKAADREAAAKAGLDVLTVGRQGDFIALKRVEHERYRQELEVACDGRPTGSELPLAGDFQVANALVSAGLAISTGVDTGHRASPRWKSSRARPGGSIWSAHTPNGALVYVDYAHKPEALEQVLLSVRPFTTGEIVVVFGAGGDRDPGQAADHGRGRQPACRPRLRHGRQSALRRPG